MLYNAVGYLKQCSYKVWSPLNTTGTKGLARSLLKMIVLTVNVNKIFWRKKALKKMNIL